jgi:two-component system, sensor histidine kinase and response regulator
MTIDYLKNKTLLIVDDVKLNIKIVTNLLKDTSINIISTTDPREVVSLCQQNKPHLILLDYEMPHLSGLEVCELLKKDEKFKEIPIVFFTSFDDEENISRAFNAGGIDYLVKPVKKAELVARVQNIVAQQHLLKEVNITKQQLHGQLEEHKTLTRVLIHDVVNPLTIFQGIIRRIRIKIDRKESDDEFVLTQMDKMSEAYDRIMELIEYIKEARSLEENKKEIKLVPVDLIAVLKETQSIFQEKLQNKNLTLNLGNIEEMSELWITSEKVTVLNSVINNIISNSIKFSFEDSSIDLHVEDFNNMIILSVRDHGVGMGQELINKVFDKNSATTRLGTDGEKGTGFGMPLVKAYMEKYNGHIRILSSEKTDKSTKHGTKTILTFLKAKSPAKSAA